MLYINIDPDDSYKKKKLIEDITELRSAQNPPGFTLSNLASLDTDIQKEDKKKKKKKKKKCKLSSLSALREDSVMGDDELDLSGLVDIDTDKLNFLISEGEDNIADIIIGEGRDYDKYKKSKIIRY